MALLLLALLLILLGGTLALLLGRDEKLASWAGAGGAVLGALVGLVPALETLAGGPGTTLRLPWSLPLGGFVIGLDPLSAFFLVVILGLCALAAVYGTGYLRGHGRAGSAWFFFDALMASMALAVVARDAVLFLIAWELMTLSSYFLVVRDDEDESARQAGWTYLIAAHLGTAALLLFFGLLSRQAGSTSFDAFGPLDARLSGLAFLLSLAGFGVKAGFIPLHVWLPEAHPAAPSHVSAVMSGGMIKTGIYGLLRAWIFLGPPPAWWGWTLLGVGAVSGILGVLFALAQHDLKRLLAYHSVENIGIIALGLGVGLLGSAHGLPLVALLGFGGALLHVLNHALFKGLLFLGAGAVLNAAGTRDMEHLGGLLKRMPWTGACFLIASAAICGLPPLNGFVSEFLIFLGAFLAASHGAPWGPVAIGALALIGGLALACFTKAFGVVFLGEPRGERAAKAQEAPWSMRAPMVVLAGLCVLVGLGGALALDWVSPALSQVSGLRLEDFLPALEEALGPLQLITISACFFFLALAGLIALRSSLLAGRERGESGTWDCGYAAPSARMQYTASSFAQPLTELFAPFLCARERSAGPEGLFPERATFATETPDAFRERLYRPAFEGALKAAWKLRWLQHGRIQLYVLYIALTLMALLLWRLG